MSGLLGSMIAGGVKQVSQGRLDQLDRQDQFNMQNALLKAREDMDIRLKEAGINMQEAAAGRERERVKGYFTPGEDGQPVGITQAAENAARNGDVETAKGLINSQPANQGKNYESIKLDDGSLASFDKSTGKAEVILPSGKTINVPNNEVELALLAADGSAKKAMELLVQQKAKVAAAGRAPVKESLDERAYADWKKKPQNKDKGLDDFLAEKSNWGKSGAYDDNGWSESYTYDKGRMVKKERAPKGAIDPTDPAGLREILNKKPGSGL